MEVWVKTLGCFCCLCGNHTDYKPVKRPILVLNWNGIFMLDIAWIHSSYFLVICDLVDVVPSFQEIQFSTKMAVVLRA